MASAPEDAPDDQDMNGANGSAPAPPPPDASPPAQPTTVDDAPGVKKVDNIHDKKETANAVFLLFRLTPDDETTARSNASEWTRDPSDSKMFYACVHLAG
eukprot:Unigene5020_Nuclearia_a/m.15399 Unigene5020_Nuclearia_a/g.15399  ORF Unigene5020_Nuclearia_a/g.15399 Unigene5020_Nuclearia_a/m.15399 type:complete len:100 (+) Unigene5020_Nuclearia_a:145-444(+)